MRDKASFSPAAVDVIALAKAQAEGHGELGPAALPRLAESVESITGPVQWSVQGAWHETEGREPQVRLHLHARAQAVLICQRCLDVLQQLLVVEQTLRFVQDPELAERLDEETEDEDVLALPRRLNLVELIEDELIMALPIVPRHEACPAAPRMVYEDADPMAAAEEVKPHPFAALAALRGGKPGT